VITWVGFIGKLFEFALERIVGRKIDLGMDEKKQAARAFVRLYESMEVLEKSAGEFLVAIQPIVDGKKVRIYKAWMSRLPRDINQGSAEFLSVIQEVRRVVRFYDVDLAVFLSDILVNKVRISAFDSMKFQIDWDEEHHLRGLSYTIPSESLMRAELQPFFPQKYGEIGMWPENNLVALFERQVNEGTVAVDDVPKIIWLHQKASEQLPLLTQARKHLGEFIKTNFTLTELIGT
jgi:hypothetical protein